MPNDVLYYKYILDLCDVTGDYVRERALLNDIKKGELASAGTILAIADSYKGEVSALANKFKKDENAVSGAWNSLKELLQDCGQYSDEDAKVFGQQLCKTEEVCDFRKMVRTWARREQAKAKAGKEVTFYSFRGFLDRYEALILKRTERKNRHS